MKKRNQALVLGAAALMASCAGPTDDGDLVARVEDHVFTVDQAVDLLANEERLAADVGVVESLADLWIDYTLLTEAAANDTTFPDLDLRPLVMRQITQTMVFALRDSMIQIDTFVTEGELRERYESEAPAVEMRARHIMFQLPIQATAQQRDSVFAALQAVRDRVAAGESFETLAMQVSQDPGSSALGGDLGIFQKGQMVAPFEEAVLALEPGEVSEVVETPMGLHLIRLDERRVRAFDQVATAYRSQVQARLVAEAESIFVSALVDSAEPTVVEAAADVAREIAQNPGSRLSGRATRRELVTWDGGAVTVGDFQEVMWLEPPQLRQQIAAGTDEEIKSFLEGLARRNLLIREAENNGLAPSADSVDVLVDDAKAQLRQATRMLGLFELDRAPGEPLATAITRTVERALEGNLTGATQVVPLGLVAFQLRDGRSTAIFPIGVGQVIVNVAQIRATRSLSPLEQSLDPVPTPDTVGR